MNKPNGDLEILREYTCGCIVYRDHDGNDWQERGLLCAGTLTTAQASPTALQGLVMHARALVRGVATRDGGLFS